MTKSERRVYLLSMALAIAAATLPLLCQIDRLLGTRFYSYVLLLPSYILSWSGLSPGLRLYAFLIFPFFATPILVAWGIGFSLFVRKKMTSREPNSSTKPSPYVFTLCGLLWLFVGFSFSVLPLFAGESGVRRDFLDAWRNFLDGWLDKLLL